MQVNLFFFPKPIVGQVLRSLYLKRFRVKSRGRVSSSSQEEKRVILESSGGLG